MPLLDRLEPLAKRVGAVNTVVKAQDGRLVGATPMSQGSSNPSPNDWAWRLFRMARILGTGGAARAIAAGLANKASPWCWRAAAPTRRAHSSTR